MNFNEYYFKEVASKCFKGTCDRIRRVPGGELFWQEMMKNKKKISEKEFLKNIDPSDVLDDCETWGNLKTIIDQILYNFINQ